LPANLKGTQYYHPLEAGEERRLTAIYQKLEEFKNKK
jgi:putative ATPase